MFSCAVILLALTQRGINKMSFIFIMIIIEMKVLPMVAWCLAMTYIIYRSLESGRYS